ncbi:MAG TPA: hypothetical protein VFD13_08615 [Candidatus Kapabacteria bacterium]|nr:hypothetical protein [Candidatus Kapabacteria bacterium]
MTFQECYEQVILPTFERLKADYEKRYPSARGEILIQGSSHALGIEYPANEKGLLGWYWNIAFVPDEGDEGTATIFYLAGADASHFREYTPSKPIKFRMITAAMIVALANQLKQEIDSVITAHKRQWPDTYK